MILTPDQDKDAALRDLARVTPIGWATYVNRGWWRPADHHCLIADAILETIAEHGRLIVTTPPRHGKSELVSRATPGWYLGNNPDHRVILASYGGDYAAEWGRRVRNDLTEYGPEVFGVRVSTESSAANRWDLDGARGGMISAGVDGSITGRGANLAIIDDPVKSAKEAHSETYREAAWRFWQHDLRTRLHPGAAVILVQTRWHEDDLGGRLLNQAGEKWRHLNLPALAIDGDPLGRAPGDALWPDMYPVEDLARIRSEVGAYAWASLYQQDPQPAGGGVFRAEWFHRYGMDQDGAFVVDGYPVERDALVRFATVDLAVSLKDTAAFTVVMTFGAAPSGHLLVLDVDRRRMEGPDHIPAMRAAIDKWGCQSVWVEKVGFQSSLIQQAVKAGLPARELIPDRDKLTRCHAAAPYVEQGRVLFPDFTVSGAARWIGDLEDELLAVPNGAYWDQADAFAYGVKAWKEHVRRPRELRRVHGRRDPWGDFAQPGSARDIFR